MNMTATRKTVLITGASSGIGRELALIFAKNNHNVVLVARNENALKDLAEHIEKNHAAFAFVISKDLSSPDACMEIKAILDQNSIEIDMLINNAGFGLYKKFQNASYETNSEMIAVNITALTQLTRLILPNMLKRDSGKIVNIASILAYFPLPFIATYSATKAYVLSFSKSLAEELRNTGVSVTLICPGSTKTLFNQRAEANAIKRIEKVPQMTAYEVAVLTYKAVMNNKKIVVTGIKNKITVVILPIILKIFGLRLARHFMREIK